MAKAVPRGQFNAINILIRKQMSLAQRARKRKTNQQHSSTRKT